MAADAEYPDQRLTDSERSRLDAWHRIAAHQFFTECYDSDDTLINAMIEKIDKVHEYLTEVDKAADDHQYDYEYA